ncbi:MAG: sigma-70 family RNA polymerase sigma factor [Acetatifactor sp.]|nr:sigma-70 family RNA polymerase sigma factor [Acetatifactor sp.]
MEEIYKENAKIVYHFLLSLCRDRDLAEDMTQETFLQAYRSLERYDGSCKLSSWLCQIAKHLYYQNLAKWGKELPVDLTEADEADTSPQPEETVLRRLELLDVLKEMQKLPQQTREVMYLRLIGSLSFKEIGEILGKSENWARVTFYRGKEKLIQAAKDADRKEEFG